MSADQIVITGMGLVTPLGTGVDAVWKRLLGGESGIRPLVRFDVSDLNTKFAGQVPGAGEPDGLDPETVISSKDLKKIDAFTLFALAATEEALQQANWHPTADSEKDATATIIGTGIGGFPVITEAVRTLDTRGPRRISPFVVPAFLGNLAAGNVSIRYGFRGPIGAPVTACAAGLQAIGDGMRLIASGEADVVIAGGTEACIDRLTLAGFGAARALSTENDSPATASKPYDSQRAGFVLGEGAGIVVLERRSHAEKRGATPLVALTGYGTSADAYHLTAGPADGSGAALAIHHALARANISSSEVNYINGHATSTPVGDAAEIAAMRAVFGDNLASIPVSSTKSSTGHMLGAAGSVEAIFTAMAVINNKIPATLNFTKADEGAEDLDFVPDLNRTAEVQIAVCNAFGFGGVNASLVLEKI